MNSISASDGKGKNGLKFENVGSTVLSSFNAMPENITGNIIIVSAL